MWDLIVLGAIIIINTLWSMSYFCAIFMKNRPNDRIVSFIIFLLEIFTIVYLVRYFFIMYGGILK